MGDERNLEAVERALPDVARAIPDDALNQWVIQPEHLVHGRAAAGPRTLDRPHRAVLHLELIPRTPEAGLIVRRVVEERPNITREGEVGHTTLFGQSTIGERRLTLQHDLNTSMRREATNGAIRVGGGRPKHDAPREKAGGTQKETGPNPKQQHLFSDRERGTHRKTGVVLPEIFSKDYSPS